MLPVGGCDHAVSATTCQALLVLTFAGFGAQPWTSHVALAECVYWQLQRCQGRDRICFVAPPLCDGDKTHRTRCVFGVPPTRRGHSKTSWSGHGPDTRTLLRLSVARSYQDVLMFGKVNVNGGNRWLRSLRDHNHLCQVWGSLQPVKGSLAPLTRP